MEYLHNERDEQVLSLHDCRANRAELKDGVLSFWFEDGFWVTQSHPENPTGKTIRTGPSRVDYVLRDADGDDVTVDVFKRLRWPHSLRTSWELEFLYQYPGGWNRIIECWLWFKEKPRHRECQLNLDVQEVIYRWNDLHPKCEW